MKKRITIFLCFALALGLFCTAVAMGRTREVFLSEEAAAAYARYELDTAALAAAAPDGNICNQILSQCTLASLPDDERLFTAYTSDTLSAYIPLCRSLTDISSSSSELVAIDYEAVDGCRVILTYEEDHLSDKVIYDEASDTAFIQDGRPTRLVKNFRYGSTTRYFHILGLEIAVPLPAWWPGSRLD